MFICLFSELFDDVSVGVPGPVAENHRVTQEGPQFSLGFPDKEMQDGCLIHNNIAGKITEC